MTPKAFGVALVTTAGDSDQKRKRPQVRYGESVLWPEVSGHSKGRRCDHKTLYPFVVEPELR